MKTAEQWAEDILPCFVNSPYGALGDRKRVNAIIQQAMEEAARDMRERAAMACKAVERIHAAANDVMYSAVAGQCRQAVQRLHLLPE